MRSFFNLPADWLDPVDRAKLALLDLSVPMERVSRVMYDDSREVYSSGLSEWPAMSQLTIERWGYHRLMNHPPEKRSGTTLADWTERAWSRKNAAVLNRAPHAHLQEEGTRQYATARYSARSNASEGRTRRRRSRGEVRESARTEGNGWQHSPQRDLVFVNEASVPRFHDIVLDWWAEEVPEQ
jgi:hypothetical protein